MKRPEQPKLLLLRDIFRLTGGMSPLSSVACPALRRRASRRPPLHPFPSQQRHRGEYGLVTSSCPEGLLFVLQLACKAGIPPEIHWLWHLATCTLA